MSGNKPVPVDWFQHVMTNMENRHHFSLEALKKAVQTNRGNVCLCVREQASESVHSSVNFSMGNMSLWGKMG